MGDQFPHRSHVRAARQIPHLVYAGRALHPPLATPHFHEVHDLQCGGDDNTGRTRRQTWRERLPADPAAS